MCYVRTGCRWQATPREYGSPATCWRRLRAWEEDGTWEKIRQCLLTLLDGQAKLQWTRAFLDGSFVPAKKGDVKFVGPRAARALRSCWSSTGTVYPSAFA